MSNSCGQWFVLMRVSTPLFLPKVNTHLLNQNVDSDRGLLNYSPNSNFAITLKTYLILQ